MTVNTGGMSCRNGKVRLVAMLGASGLAAMSLTACASDTPEMAAGWARPQGMAAAPTAPSPAPSSAARAGQGRGASAATDSDHLLNGGRYKLGAPYQAGGLWYVPAEQPTYDEVGVASWYGDDFNGQATANGERFDMYGISAAHATLPMPCIVEVTNLENGKTLKVRMNDRGPFKNGRIIDLSRGAAQQLGYMDKGTAKVRVRYVGPARLDGSLEPLFVANAGPAKPLQQLAALQAPAAPAAVQTVWKAEPSAPVAPARQFAPPPAPAPAHAQPASTGSSYASAAADGFSVQAGAFGDKAKAQRIADTLSGAGSVAVRPLEMPDKTIYRVVVGPWRDPAKAQAARVQVIAAGYADARVIKAF